MKIKATINFIKLRNEGISALDIKDDEIVQVLSKDGIKCIVDQEYLLSLLAKIQSLESSIGVIHSTTPHNPQLLMQKFQSKMNGVKLLRKAEDQGLSAMITPNDLNLSGSVVGAVGSISNNIVKEKIKDHNYYGFGFLVPLKNVTFIKMNNEWIPKIDVRAIADIEIKNMKDVKKITGAHIQFIRTYFEFSLTELAIKLDISIDLVKEWEKNQNKEIKINVDQKKSLIKLLEVNLKNKNRIDEIENKLSIMVDLINKEDK